MKTYITYFDDQQIEQYGLKTEGDVVAFKGNDVTISGDSINYLNDFYCDLTTWYWVWKNTNDDVICLKQYRRPFDTDLKPKEGEAITYAPMNLGATVHKQYGACHGTDRASEVYNFITEKYGANSDIAKYWNESTQLYTNNTIIINRKDFDELCEFVFGFLFYMDERLGYNKKPEKYREGFRKHKINTPYNIHFMSFIGERMISAFIACRMNVVTIPRNNKCINLGPYNGTKR